MEVFFGKVGHYLVSVIQVVQIIFIVGTVSSPLRSYLPRDPVCGLTSQRATSSPMPKA